MLAALAHWLKVRLLRHPSLPSHTVSRPRGTACSQAVAACLPRRTRLTNGSCHTRKASTLALKPLLLCWTTLATVWASELVDVAPAQAAEPFETTQHHFRPDRRPGALGVGSCRSSGCPYAQPGPPVSGGGAIDELLRGYTGLQRFTGRDHDQPVPHRGRCYRLSGPEASARLGARSFVARLAAASGQRRLRHRAGG